MNIDEAPQIRRTIREYIVESFLDEGDTITIQDDDDLLEILDSLQILRTVADLMHRFHIEVDNGDLTPENFGSVARMAAFVSRKQQEA